MEKNGQSYKIANSLAQFNISKNMLYKSTEMASHKMDATQLLHDIHEIGRSRNIQDVINTERLLIESDIREIQKGSTYLGTITSLETAQNDLANSLKSLAKVQDINDYKSFNEGISEKKIDRVNGLPRDAFHRFIDSNITRINNSIISPKVPVYEKNILTERKANMKIAKEEYMKLQAIALEIKLPEKSKEHER